LRGGVCGEGREAQCYDDGETSHAFLPFAFFAGFEIDALTGSIMTPADLARQAITLQQAHGGRGSADRLRVLK
jgi:hypothetical protein